MMFFFSLLGLGFSEYIIVFGLWVFWKELEKLKIIVSCLLFLIFCSCSSVKFPFCNMFFLKSKFGLFPELKNLRPQLYSVTEHYRCLVVWSFSSFSFKIFLKCIHLLTLKKMPSLQSTPKH